MKNKDLQELLKQFPDDMKIWVSDGGNGEGGQPLVKVEKVLAMDAGLDGDSVDDEYIWVDDKFLDVAKYLSNGYIMSDDGEYLTKEIIYLNGD
jgi:hypothetical protein